MAAGVGAGVTIATGAGSAGAAAAIHGAPQTCGDALKVAADTWKEKIVGHQGLKTRLSPITSLLLQIFDLDLKET